MVRNKLNKLRQNRLANKVNSSVIKFHDWLIQNGVINKNSKKTVRLAFLVTAFAAGILFTGLTASTENSSDSSRASELAAHRDNLRGQVDDAAGSPRSGRDPANQKQSSLAAAASSPTSVGSRTDKPASAVKGDRSTRHKHSDVYGHNNDNGINSAGCYYDYGKQGEQCLSAHIAPPESISCKEVRQYFTEGIKVTGEDRFNLDKNGDGIACNKGD